MIPNPNKIKTIRTNALSDAALVSLPIVDQRHSTNVLGELGWEPSRAVCTENYVQPRPHTELSAVTNDGGRSHVSDERVKASPSSARLCPSGIGNLTAHAVRAGTCPQNSARQLCSYRVSPSNQSGTSHCCIISAAAPAIMPKG